MAKNAMIKVAKKISPFILKGGQYLQSKLKKNKKEKEVPKALK